MPTRKSNRTETFTPLDENDPEGFDAPEEVQAAGDLTSIVPAGDDAELVTEDEAANISNMYSLNVTPDDIKMPVIKLMQGISPMVMEGDAKAGEWVIERKPSKSITVTIHGIARTQRRSTREGDSFMTLCQARAPLGQQLVGVGDPGIQCAACPFSQWSGDDSGNRRPPPCTQGYEMLVETDTGKYALMQFERTAYGTGKDVCTIVAQNGSKPTPVTFTSELQQRGSNRYYMPKASAAS